MERDTDAPGGITWTTAYLLKMSSYQGLGPVMLKRGPIHQSAHITPEIIKNTSAGTPPRYCESGSGGWAQQAVLQHMFYTTKCEKQTGESGLSV